MADISKITLPSGTTYDIKDAQARSDISDLQSGLTGGVKVIGETTTALTDQATTSPITVNNADVTPETGNLVFYNKKEFLWNGTKWIEMGDLTTLKALAYKDSASGSVAVPKTFSKPSFTGTEGNVSVSGTPAGSVAISVGTGTANYTPEGSVSKPSFTGTEGNVSVSGTPNGSVSISVGTGTANYTPAGTVSQPTFSGTEGDVSVSGTPKGSISVGTGTANYTPAGSVAAPTISVKTAGATTTVNSITAVGTLPSLTTTVADETLTIGWSAGTLPTKGSNTTVKTGDAAYQASAPAFTGTGAELKFTGTSTTSTGKFTPSGSVSQPTFTGTGKELKATFTGSTSTSTGKFTPAGDVSKPSFTGTGKELKATFTGTSMTSTGKFTPAGSVAAPTVATTENKTVTVS